jgi:hypothetical protein
MSSTLSPEETPADDALCLQDRPTTTDLAIANARSFPDAVRAACLKFCEGRPDLLAHAVWSPAIGELLEPLGVLFGEEAIVHGELAGSLFRLIAGEGEMTPITAAALKAGGPVWIPSIPRVGWKGTGRLLRSHGIKSGGAFPFVANERVVAVIELLSFESLQCDLASNALAEELTPMIATRYTTLNLAS